MGVAVTAGALPGRTASARWGEGVRVLHITHRQDAGGVPAYLKGLALHQRKMGLDVGLLAPDVMGLAEACRREGCTLKTWNASRGPSIRLPDEIRSLRRGIEAFGPDVVHLHSSKAGLAGRVLLRRRIPTLFQPHAWSFYAPGHTRAAAKAWERFGARWAQLLVCGSVGEALAASEHRVRAPILVAPNGVDVDHYAGVAVLPGDALRAPIVLCMGRMVPQKGHDVLLRAWKIVQSEVPTAELWLVGHGDQASRIAEMARGLSNVRLFGWTDDPRWFYERACLVVVASRYETLSLSMLEAMASGRPVVSTGVHGAREAISQPGRECGAVVPIGDSRTLAAAVVLRLTNSRLLYEECSRAQVAAQRYAAKYSYDLITTATVELASRTP